MPCSGQDAGRGLAVGCSSAVTGSVETSSREFGSLVVVLSPTGNHQNRRNDHHRDENEYNGGQENFIQHLIKHDDDLPR